MSGTRGSVADPAGDRDGAAAATGRWRVSPAVRAAGLGSLGLLVAGVVASRPDVALVGAPLLVAVALAWDRRPRGTTIVRAEADARPEPGRPDPATGVQGPASLRYRVVLDPPEGVELVRLRLTAFGTVRQEVVVDAASARSLTGVLPVVHSGDQRLIAVDAVLLGPDGSASRLLAPAAPVRRVIAPVVRRVAALPVPDRLRGVAGGHPTGRLGDGGEFRDIGRFQPGDRLRRIDWRTTARLGGADGALFVRRSTALADAVILLVIDSRDDVGPRVRDWNAETPAEPEPTSMDLAREAAASLAAGYLAAGDRVGLRDLGTTARALPPGGGPRHLDRLLSAIALARPKGAPQRRRRPPMLPPGALVVVLSTFLDDDAARTAELWRASGHRVVAIDVLPETDVRGLNPYEVLAFRVVMAERQERIGRAERAGVETLRWRDGEAGRAVALRLLARRGPGSAGGAR